MRRLTLISAFLLLSSPGFLRGQNGADLLFSDDFSVSTPRLPETIHFVTFNLHGPPTQRIEDVYEVLQQHENLRGADIYMLQEVNRGHAGSGNRDIGRELARLLETRYTYAVEIEHGQGGGVRGLAILSRFPLEDTRRLLLPVDGPGGRRRIALGTTVRFGSARLRLYNLHLETRISARQRADQIRGLLEDARDYDGLPTVIAGDFNTITSSSVDSMFEVLQEAGFSTPLPGNEITFRRAFLVRMVLDWIWARNVSIQEAAVESEIRVSDHRPLWFTIALDSLLRQPSD